MIDCRCLFFFLIEEVKHHLLLLQNTEHNKNVQTTMYSIVGVANLGTVFYHASLWTLATGPPFFAVLVDVCLK